MSARISGVPTGLFYTLLLCLSGLTVVLLINVVGVVLVIALLPPRRKVTSHEPAGPRSGASENTPRVSCDVREP